MSDRKKTDKKNQKAGKKTSASKGKKQVQPELPDRKTMTEFLSTLDVANQGDSLIRAQELIYQAWETEKASKRIELAGEALRISPLCADAYVLLADEGQKPIEEMIALYAKGVEAGELALGGQAFKEDKGMFWQMIETRPYMRAREGLAHMLLMTGKKEEAAKHFYEMLELNPDDNQGIRYLLATCLQELDDRERLRQLFKVYKEEMNTLWVYAETLLSFRETGASQQSQKLLQKAWDTNPHVRAYLTGEKSVPEMLPEYVRDGSEEDAIDYAMGNIFAWVSTPGAIEWIVKATLSFKMPEETKGSA